VAEEREDWKVDGLGDEACADDADAKGLALL